MIRTPVAMAFAQAIVEGKSGAEAIDTAFPHNTWSSNYKRVKAYRMLMNDNVSHEIEDRRAIMERNADLAAARIQTIITDGKEHNALEASKFAIEQIDGRAKQTTEVKASMVNVVYDLSGGAAGEIPPEIQAKLNG